MNGVNKVHISVLVSFIVGICVGLLVSRFDIKDQHLDDHNLKTWTCRIVYSPDSGIDYGVVDTGVYSFYFHNREDATKLHK